LLLRRFSPDRLWGNILLCVIRKELGWTAIPLLLYNLIPPQKI
jgi:hypothetical protein